MSNRVEGGSFVWLLIGDSLECAENSDLKLVVHSPFGKFFCGILDVGPSEVQANSHG